MAAHNSSLTASAGLRDGFGKQVVGLAAVAAALLIKMALQLWIDPHQTPFLLFPAAVIVAAWFGGWKSGIVATVVATMLSAGVYLSPGRTPGTAAAIWVSTGLFLLECGIICLIAELMLRQRDFVLRRVQESAREQRQQMAHEQATQQARDDAATRDALFGRLVDANIFGMMVCELSGAIVDANAEFLRILGFLRADLDAGQLNWRRLTPAEHAEADQYRMRELRESGRISPAEKELFSKTGHRVPVWFGAASMGADRMICFVMDLTNQKRAAEALLLAKEVAEQANRSRGEFLANVSHELRTPMNAILGLTELALEEELPRSVRDYLDTSVDAARTLLYLLNDLLDFTRIEAGRIDMESLPFSLRNTLEQAIRILALRAADKGIQLVCSITPGTPDNLIGDQGRLRQILLNLVGNAIKFTQQGEVAVEVGAASRRTTAKGEEVTLAFSIRDSGIGIAEADRERIFEPFTQADGSLTRSHGGTGLGLPIVKQLVERMEGSLMLESRLGEGSTFHVTLPFPLAPAVSERSFPEAPEDLRGLRVLAIDDNQVHRQILHEILTSWALRPTVVSDGHAALREMREAASQGIEFPVILVDALMPAMNGLQFVQTATAEGLLRGAAILMLSAADRPVLEPQIRALPIAAWINKPVSQSDLLDSLMNVLLRPQAESVELRPISTTKRALEILVVEDAPANRKVVKGILEKRGHQITLADNGRDAVELIAHTRFDVVLMDVQMPIMDGWRATQLIRHLPLGRRVPIVAMTAHAMRGDRERCLAAGMDGYIAKPLDARELIRQVERLARSAEMVGGDVSLDALDCFVRPQSEIEGCDGIELPEHHVAWDEALQRLGGDTLLLQDMVTYFLEDVPRLIDVLREERSGDAAIRAAHSIKGLAGTIGARGAAVRATQVESQLRQGHDCSELIEDLSQLLEQTFAELRRRQLESPIQSPASSKE